MNELDKKFRHHAWFKNCNLTRRQAIEYFAHSGDFWLTQKPSKSQSEYLMNEPLYDDVLKGAEDGRTYCMSKEEIEYYIKRRDFWNSFFKIHGYNDDKSVPEYADYRKAINEGLKRA